MHQPLVRVVRLSTYVGLFLRIALWADWLNARDLGGELALYAGDRGRL